MNSADIFECVKYGFNQLKANPLYHVVLVLLISVISCISVGLLIGPLFVGYYMLLLKDTELESKKVANIFASTGLFCGFKKFKASFLAGFIPFFILAIIVLIISSFFYKFNVTLIVLISIPISLIIPTMLVSLLLVAEAEGESDGILALKKSININRNNLVSGALCSIALFSITAGGVALGGTIGAIVIIPFVIGVAVYFIVKDSTMWFIILLGLIVMLYLSVILGSFVGATATLPITMLGSFFMSQKLLLLNSANHKCESLLVNDEIASESKETNISTAEIVQ